MNEALKSIEDYMKHGDDRMHAELHFIAEVCYFEAAVADFGKPMDIDWDIVPIDPWGF